MCVAATQQGLFAPASVEAAAPGLARGGRQAWRALRVVRARVPLCGGVLAP